MTSLEALRSPTDPHTLGDALPLATQRARAQILLCHGHTDARMRALADLLEEELQRADRAMIEPHIVRMVVAFKGLQMLDIMVNQRLEELP